MQGREIMQKGKKVQGREIMQKGKSAGKGDCAGRTMQNRRDMKGMSEVLRRAREYEAEAGRRVPEETRPSFHVTPTVGWMNDPNGFSLYQGEYHLFYQYYPYDVQRGPMHWGHCKTKDFVCWERLPCAIAPDTAFDGGGCFSGSAVEADGKHLLMYTSVMEDRLPDGSMRLIQNQSIAEGDGINYEKLPENPVITSEMLPEGCSWKDFRDPKIWKEQGQFYAVMGNRKLDGGNEGLLFLFSSEDAKNWKLEKLLDRGGGEWGGMWECPDFFALEKAQVLVVSPQFMKEKELEFREGSNSVYFVGFYDREKLEFARDKAYPLDYGMDFYAPQTMEAEDGRRILIGWMQNYENNLLPEGMLWTGMMTIPRALVGKRLRQLPVRELENYRRNKTDYTEICVSDVDGRISLDGIKGRSLDLNVEIQGGEYEEFTVWLACGEGCEIALIYQKKEGIFTLDRSKSGMKNDQEPCRSMRVSEGAEVIDKLNMRILMDKVSLEVFVNDGMRVMSSLLYTPLAADKISFSARGRAVFSVEKYDL